MGALLVYDFELFEVELGQHSGGNWCLINPDVGQLEKAVSWLPPNAKDPCCASLLPHAARWWGPLV